MITPAIHTPSNILLSINQNFIQFSPYRSCHIQAFYMRLRTLNIECFLSRRRLSSGRREIERRTAQIWLINRFWDQMNVCGSARGSEALSRPYIWRSEEFNWILPCYIPIEICGNQWLKTPINRLNYWNYRTQWLSQLRRQNIYIDCHESTEQFFNKWATIKLLIFA